LPATTPGPAAAPTHAPPELDAAITDISRAAFKLKSSKTGLSSSK